MRSRNPIDRELDGPHSRLELSGAEKSLFSLRGIELRLVQPVARRYTDWAIPVPQLFIESKIFKPDLRKYNEFHLNLEVYDALKGEGNMERERKR
jgi:hypothetical protein